MCPNCAATTVSNVQLAIVNDRLIRTLGVMAGALQLLVEAADGHVTSEGVKARVNKMRIEMQAIEREVR